MRAWQFRQKTPGFGISKNFYLSVLAATAQLPAIREVADPKATAGAVEGFGAPLAPGSQKEDLTRPMERGVYVIASKDRQTVLRLMVIPTQEAGFEPEPFLRSAEAKLLSPEHLSRISATWTLLQLTFETHEAMVYKSLKFLLAVAQRLADLTQGVISDPLSRTYLLPSEAVHRPQADERVDARDFVRFRYGAEKGWAYSLGFQKFALPEVEIFGVSDSMRLVAQRFIVGVAQSVLLGKLLEPGRHLGSRRCPLLIASGGLDRRHWEGIPCYELLPPAGGTVDEALAVWSEDSTPSPIDGLVS